MRRELLDRRRDRTCSAAAVADRSLTGVLLAAPELAGLGPGATVAGYVPLPGEPSPSGALAELSAAGAQVLLPVLLPSGDLDWAPAGPRGSAPGSWVLTAARSGTSRPVSAPRGPAAIGGVDAVLIPGVAGDSGGRRLGRGGGSYDRALSRLDSAVSGRPWTCLLLWPDEVVARVPAEAHDRCVDALATADGITRPAGGAGVGGR